MHRVALVLLLAAAVTAPPSSLKAQINAGQRPNVVLIITDDVGYGDLGSYGAPDVRTPHIDSLARDGVRLTDFYANGATCTPTRTGLISGRYQQRFRLEQPLGAAGRMDWDRGLPLTGSSLPRLLKNNGYATALIGKWHLGGGVSSALSLTGSRAAVFHRRCIQRGALAVPAPRLSVGGSRQCSTSWPVR